MFLYLPLRQRVNRSSLIRCIGCGEVSQRVGEGSRSNSNNFSPVHQTKPVDRILMSKQSWDIPFMDLFRILNKETVPLKGRWALVVLNQPFSRDLFDLLWHACKLYSNKKLIYINSV